MEYTAGLNWIIVSEKLEKKDPFELPKKVMSKEREVISVGSCSPDLEDSNLTTGVSVTLELNSHGVRLNDELVAYRRTQIVAIINK